MRVGSLFAGIGGFDLAAERAGVEVVWQSEIDRHASRVLDHHWPAVKNLGDVHGIEDAPGVDVLTGGFPCQDYSVAGRGAGLAGDRGALWWQYHRLIAELNPRWVVAENVDGLTNRAHRASLRTIIGSLVSLGYGVVWRVFDARYFGVAQRRNRVFIVGHSGGQPRPEILALAQGVSGDSPPRREAGSGVAALTASGLGGGGPDDNLAQAGHLIAPPIVAGHARGDHAGPEGQLVVGFNSRQDDPAPAYELSGTVDTSHTNQAVAFAQNQRDELRELDQASSLNAERWGTAKNVTLIAIQGTMVGRHTEAGPAGKGWDDSGSMFTLDTSTPPHHIASSVMVRRLTPLECERLQGFPDGWTDIPGNSDTQRYRQLGNAVAVPVAEWILKRLMSVGRLKGDPDGR